MRQQWREETDELWNAAAAIAERHRAWDARRKALEEAAAECNELALGLTAMGPKIACWACADKIVALIGPEPTDG